MMGKNDMNDLRSGTMRANIRRGERTRVVIVGCGLGGLKLAMGLRHSGFQIVVVDKNNYNATHLPGGLGWSGAQQHSVSYPATVSRLSSLLFPYG